MSLVCGVIELSSNSIGSGVLCPGGGVWFRSTGRLGVRSLCGEAGSGKSCRIATSFSIAPAPGGAGGLGGIPVVGKGEVCFCRCGGLAFGRGVVGGVGCTGGAG